MGRELKRVDKDFNWELHKVWKGYLNPLDTSVPCDLCHGKGSSQEYQDLYDLWYGHSAKGEFLPEMRASKPYRPDDPVIRAIVTQKLGLQEREPGSIYRRRSGSRIFQAFTVEDQIDQECERLCKYWNEGWIHHLNQLDVDALIKADRLWDFTRVPITAEHRLIVKRRLESGKCNSWLPFDNGYRPTAREVNLWSLTGMGHDSSNSWYVVAAEAERLGIDTVCPKCKGECHFWPSPEAKAEYENWKEYEPPAGEAYQIWETVSEGSPISPPFLSETALASWMAATYPNDGTREDWLKFILGPGWAPSGVFSQETGMLSGAQIMQLDEEEEPAEPKLSLVVEAAVLGMAHTRISRKRLRHFVRQRRKQAAIQEAQWEAERQKMREAA